MKNLRTLLANLRKNYWSVNETWFKFICEKEFNYTPEETKSYFVSFAKSMFEFIEKCPDELVNRIANIDREKEGPIYLPTLTNHDIWRKLVYKEKGTNELKTVELNLLNELDLMQLLDYIKNDNIEIIRTLRLIDTLDSAKKMTERDRKGERISYRVYEYDLIGVSETEWDREKLLIFAELNRFTPSYCELIWNNKYGYFNSNGELFSSEKSFTTIKELLNAEGNYSSYKITGRDNYQIIGNFLTHSHLLLPEKTNKK